ncbi:hypothetical protein [Catenulispora rubra]|uniref:hypothetical protein n=1 Tax=Catenulispora rubra TaxID=280293 RepID=UPI001892850F|nr:hypothetical protein [Catenulispora rubra]
MSESDVRGLLTPVFDTAATISASLVAAAAGPTSAAAQEPARSGVDSLALSTESAAVAAGLNQLLERAATTPNGAHGSTAVHIAMAVPAAVQNTTIQVLPGITLTIDNSGVQLNLTKQAVTEVENVIGFGQTVAALVGPILAAAGVPNGAQIASIVGAALGVGNAFLKLCTAPDGSATFTVPWLGIPSCSGLTIFT